MKIKLKDMLYFNYTIGLEIVYILSYYYFFNINIHTLPYSIIHGIISSFFLFWCIISLEKSIYNGSINLIAIMNFIIGIYFQLSSIKYPYNHYLGFVEDTFKRFIFNIIIMFLIIIITLFMNRMFKLRNLNFNFSTVLLSLKFKPITLFIITNIYIILNLLTLSINLINNIVVEILLLQVFMCFVLSINCINWDKKIAKINISLLILIFLYRSMILGKRNEIMVPMIMLIIILLLLKNIKIRWVKQIVPWVGIGYILLSVIIFTASSRFDMQSDYVKSYLGNRFDVTDLALTYFEYSNNRRINTKIIEDAIVNSVPASLLANKEQYYTNAYNISNQSIGLNYSVDYGDTIISTVSQLWPGYGSVIILLIFYCWISIVNVICAKFKDLGVFIIMLNFNIILNIEITTDSFIAGIRNMIIVGYVAFLIYWILKRKNIKIKF